MLNANKPALENIESAIKHAYFEAEQGYVRLALQRLREFADEFPRNAHIAFAQGFILSKKPWRRVSRLLFV